MSLPITVWGGKCLFPSQAHYRRKKCCCFFFFFFLDESTKRTPAAPLCCVFFSFTTCSYYYISLEPTVIVSYCVCVIQCAVIPFILDVRLVDAPAGVTQEKGHTGFLIHLPFAVLALTFLARRIQPSFSLGDREVELCVPTS